MSKTIIDKLWDSHVVVKEENKPDLLYIDLHLIHEVTSPQAFAGLREKTEQLEDRIYVLPRWIITSRQ